MILLHVNGTMLETSEISMIEPVVAPKGSPTGNVSITFRSGDSLVFSDIWWFRNASNKTPVQSSIFKAMMNESLWDILKDKIKPEYGKIYGGEDGKEK